MDQKADIKVLIVDDHAVVRSGLRLLLESRAGVVVSGEASDRQQALEQLRTTAPDVVLLDLDLGQESGLSFLAELTEVLPECKILVLTGLRDPEAHHQAILRGALGVVPKERAAEVLLEALLRVARGEAWMDPQTMGAVLQKMQQQSRRTRADKRHWETLTQREQEIVPLVAQGLRNKEIADRLFISETTVRHHLTSIFSKLQVEDRMALMLLVHRLEPGADLTQSRKDRQEED